MTPCLFTEVRSKPGRVGINPAETEPATEREIGCGEVCTEMDECKYLGVGDIV